MISGFLVGDGDWVSPVLTGMRDGALVSWAVGLDSVIKMELTFYSKTTVG